MTNLRTYRWFTLLKSLVAPMMMVVLVGSQFPLSSHCYEALFGNHHSGAKMMCMKDGMCMMNMANGQSMNCNCHANNGDRPFFCSCNSSGNLIISLQLSKVLLPDRATGKANLHAKLLSSSFTNPDLHPHSKDIFHPPQVA